MQSCLMQFSFIMALSLQIVLATDASPTGVGAVVSHFVQMTKNTRPFKHAL